MIQVKKIFQTNKYRRKIRLLIPLIIALILFSISAIFDQSFQLIEDEVLSSDLNTDHIHNVLHNKESEIENILYNVANDLDEYIDKGNLPEEEIDHLFASNRLKRLDSKGLAMLIYHADTLRYYSDNSIPISNYYSRSYLGDRVIDLKNAIYVVHLKKINKTVFVGLILIKKKYPLKNEYIFNHFQEDFKIQGSVNVSFLPQTQGNSIYDSNGNFLFSLTPVVAAITDKPFYYPTVFFYFLSIIFLLVFFNRLFIRFFSMKKTEWLVIGLMSFMFFLRYLMLEYKVPANISALGLFDPFHMAVSFWFPSIGDSIFHALVIFLFAYNFYTRIDNKQVEKKFKTIPNSNLSKKNQRIKSIKSFSFVFVALSIIAFSFIFIYSFFNKLIYNSSISFEIHNFLDLNIYTFLGFFILAILFASYALVFDKLIAICSRLIHFYQFFFSMAIVGALFWLFIQFTHYNLGLISAFFLIAIVFIISFIRFRGYTYQYYFYVLIVFVISLYSVQLITKINKKKERNERSFYAEQVPVVQDQYSEFLLEQFEKQLSKDEKLKDILQVPNPDIEQVRERVLDTKYNLLWEKYDVEISACSPGDSLAVEENQKYPCFDFFQRMLDTTAVILPGLTNFYFLENDNGRITYFGWFEFYTSIDSVRTSLFIRLDSKIIPQDFGYPELLVDEKYDKPTIPQKYSYVTYKNDRLISKSGKFPYSFSRKVYGYFTKTYNYVDFNGYSHLIYNAKDNSTIIISKLKITPLDILVSFSYIFVIFYVILNIILFINKLPINFDDFQYDLKFKIQFSMISLLSLSVLIIGGGTLYYNIKQYENKYNQIISEKLKSISVQLRQNTGLKEEATSINEMFLPIEIDSLITKFAKTIVADIHLYDLNGDLITTSRPEIFEKELMGKKMNVEAYKQMEVEKKSKFIHNEQIGTYKYISAYMPFTNQNNEVVAYINLPYFSEQNQLRQEISTFVVAMINIYALLLLVAIVIAVFISSKISQPLRLVQSKIKEFRLGKKNEQILYSRNDEIGSLIKEYNRMLVELAESAEKLAKSEREGAWREMARQIAHEIKNPLTPMKLSVQLLLRAWNDQADNFSERLERIASTLIEQIERLSAIATGFSNFAKIPKANNEVIDIVEVLEKSIILFENDERVTITSNLHHFTRVEVFADKEQLSRVFINLIKNAIQAMSDEREGRIRLELIASPKRAVAKIIDNGTGIPEHLKDKLFQPTFTTKSSGMGLGLSIVKSIIVNAGGEIWFDTEMGKGTTFYVQLPVFKAGNDQSIKPKKDE